MEIRKVILRAAVFLMLAGNLVSGFMLRSEICRNRLELEGIREIVAEKGDELAGRMNDMSKENVMSMKNFYGQGRSAVESQYMNLADDIDGIGRRLSEIEHKLSIVNTKSQAIEKKVNEISVPDDAVPGYVVEQKKLAEKYLDQKQYKECSRTCSAIRDYYANDFNFIFMQYYSLFKMNPNASRNYAEISMNLKSIRERGYRNKLLDEVLEYIENESM